MLGFGLSITDAAVRAAGAVVGVQGEVELLGSLIGTNDTGAAGAANLLQMTERLNSAEWTTGNGSVTADATTAPNSTVTADAYFETVINGVHSLAQPMAKAASSKQYAFSIHAKPGLRTRVVLNVHDLANANGAFAVFDISGGQVGVVGTTFGAGWSIATVVAPVSVANGFYRCTVVVTTDASTSVVFEAQSDHNAGTAAIGNSFAGSTASAAWYGWGAQVELASAPTAYVAVTNAGAGLSALTDGDLTNFWGSQTPNAWAGMDAGAGVQLTRYRFTPRQGSSSPVSAVALDYEAAAQGATVQVSDDATFVTGVTTLDTVPATPFYPRFQLNERPLSGAPKKRYSRFLPPAGSYGQLSELKFLAAAGGTTAAKPVQPVISPYGGRYPAGSTTVTITSLTSSAKVYYTSDGSAPTNTNGTLYAGPFSFAFATAKTLKAVAYEPRLATPLSSIASAVFNPWGYKPREDWFDDRGILVEAHSGGTCYDPNTARYYWVGGSMNKAQIQAPAHFPIPRTDTGLYLYSSADLLNWRFDGNILAQPSPWISLTRPHMVFNASTSKFVIWVRGDDINFSTNGRACIATASSPTGPWTWSNTSYMPAADGYHDANLFVDTDGTGYVVNTINTQNGIRISQLASDYLSTNGSTALLTATGRESPVLFKRGSTYFLINGIANSYDGTASVDHRYITSIAANPLSGWGTLPGTSLFASGQTGTNFNGQPSFVQKINGKTDGFLFGTDFWVNSSLYGSRQVWVPLSFTDATHAVAAAPASWDLSTFT